MIISSKNGVVSFEINPSEIPYIPNPFFNNKKYIFGKKWGYNYEFPTLIISNQVYFGTKATRDFHSTIKENIFKELNLIENENGIFFFDTYAEGRVVPTSTSFGSCVGKGILQLGDVISGKKIKTFLYNYDAINQSFVGSYGI